MRARARTTKVGVEQASKAAKAGKQTGKADRQAASKQSARYTTFLQHNTIIMKFVSF